MTTGHIAEPQTDADERHFDELIRRRRMEVQAGWTEAEERHRRGGNVAVYAAPELASGEINLAIGGRVGRLLRDT